jgi:hypothetical protein
MRKNSSSGSEAVADEVLPAGAHAQAMLEPEPEQPESEPPGGDYLQRLPPDLLRLLLLLLRTTMHQAEQPTSPSLMATGGRRMLSSIAGHSQPAWWTLSAVASAATPHFFLAGTVTPPQPIAHR